MHLEREGRWPLVAALLTSAGWIGHFYAPGDTLNLIHPPAGGSRGVYIR